MACNHSLEPDFFNWGGGAQVFLFFFKNLIACTFPLSNFGLINNEWVAFELCHVTVTDFLCTWMCENVR